MGVGERLDRAAKKYLLESAADRVLLCRFDHAPKARQQQVCRNKNAGRNEQHKAAADKVDDRQPRRGKRLACKVLTDTEQVLLRVGVNGIRQQARKYAYQGRLGGRL